MNHLVRLWPFPEFPSKIRDLARLAVSGQIVDIQGFFFANGQSRAKKRILLAELRQRTSARGTTYLTGWLGKAAVVGFLADEPDDKGNPVWRLFVEEPQPAGDRR